MSRFKRINQIDAGLRVFLLTESEHMSHVDFATPAAFSFAEEVFNHGVKVGASGIGPDGGVDGGWTYCEDALPQIELSDRLFDEVQFIVTDGEIVTTCGWQAGKTGVAHAWGAWSDYGGLRRSQIIAWKPLPKPCPRRVTSLGEI